MILEVPYFSMEIEHIWEIPDILGEWFSRVDATLLLVTWGNYLVIMVDLDRDLKVGWATSTWPGWPPCIFILREKVLRMERSLEQPF